MKTAGIICEYDPFHLGHLRQFELLRQEIGEDTAIICAMSGNFVQRGMPAMWDKYTRANAAVACGADLVLELPITKVLQSAEGFAQGGVELLTQLGGVDVLCFGAECGDGNALMALAKRLDSDACNLELHRHLSEGASYAVARQLAADDKDGILSSPNNILGVEYCRAILHYKSNLTPLAVQRGGDYHAQAADSQAPSATAVRSLYPTENWRDFVPSAVANMLSDAPYYTLSNGERAMLARLRAMSDCEWEHCAHGSEGLWSKAMKACRSKSSIEEIIQAMKSKRYPRTRIQRLLMCAYLGISHSSLQSPLHYTRLLAASELGRKLLRDIKNNSTLPIINPGEKPMHQEYYRLETQASDLFTLFSSAPVSPCRLEQEARLHI